jgi:Sulfite exporter TauE/SafE
MSFAIAGFLTGIIGGLFGVGGGEIFIPLLIYLFGFSQHQAQAHRWPCCCRPSAFWPRSATIAQGT